MANRLNDRVYGSLIGGAIGDALGAPIEGMWWTDIRDQYGRLTDLVPSLMDNTGPNYASARYGGTAKVVPGVAGAVTDDTTMRHLMCLAIVRKNGRITPDDFAEVLLEKLDPNRVWINERIILQKLHIGMNPWETGRGTPPGGSASMCIAPVGIINAGDPDQAYQDGFIIAGLNTDNENRDGAATLAAAVAAAFVPGAGPKDIIDTMFEFSSDLVRRSLELSMDLALKSESVDDFAEKFYAKMLDWRWPMRRERWNKDRPVSASSIEIVPIVASLLHLCDGEPNACIIEAANFGRDCDTTASLIGNITGAMHGASALRLEWVETSEAANAGLFEAVDGDPQANFKNMADRLCEVMHAERSQRESRLAAFSAILSS